MRIVLPILMTATLAGCGDPRPDPRGIDRDEVLLRVSASGESESRPDTARFSVGVSSIAPTSEAATRANNDKMNRVMTAVEGLGVKRDDTQTQALTVNRIDYGPNKGRFEASNTISVKVRRIDDAGRVIGAATGAGANLLSGPDLSIDDREAASLSAYAAAYKAARARADVYARAAGLKVVRVLTITDGGGSPDQPQPYPMAAMARTQVAEIAPAPIRAGMNTNSATVRVDFALAK